MAFRYEVIRAVKEVTRLDRRKVRARFEERFSAQRMAREYEKQYRKLFPLPPWTVSALIQLRRNSPSHWEKLRGRPPPKDLPKR